MPSRDDDIVAVRRELLDLLHPQMDMLNSSSELTDGQLRECYDRQGRVRELGEKLQAYLISEQQSLATNHRAPASEHSTEDFSGVAVHMAAPLREPAALS
jgi:hypothetical protein